MLSWLEMEDTESSIDSIPRLSNWNGTESGAPVSLSKEIVVRRSLVGSLLTCALDASPTWLECLLFACELVAESAFVVLKKFVVLASFCTGMHPADAASRFKVLLDAVRRIRAGRRGDKPDCLAAALFLTLRDRPVDFRLPAECKEAALRRLRLDPARESPRPGSSWSVSVPRLLGPGLLEDPGRGLTLSPCVALDLLGPGLLEAPERLVQPFLSSLLMRCIRRVFLTVCSPPLTSVSS